MIHSVIIKYLFSQIFKADSVLFIFYFNFSVFSIHIYSIPLFYCWKRGLEKPSGLLQVVGPTRVVKYQDLLFTVLSLTFLLNMFFSLQKLCLRDIQHVKSFCLNDLRNFLFKIYLLRYKEVNCFKKKKVESWSSYEHDSNFTLSCLCT